MGLIMWENEGDDNHLDSLTRHKMSQTEVFNNEFYIMLFVVLLVFGFGFLAGNIAHDSVFHAVEQNMK